MRRVDDGGGGVFRVPHRRSTGHLTRIYSHMVPISRSDNQYIYIIIFKKAKQEILQVFFGRRWCHRLFFEKLFSFPFFFIQLTPWPRPNHPSFKCFIFAVCLRAVSPPFNPSPLTLLHNQHDKVFGLLQTQPQKLNFESEMKRGANGSFESNENTRRKKIKINSSFPNCPGVISFATGRKRRQKWMKKKSGNDERRMIETLPPIWCSRILFPIPPWPWLMLIQFISEYIYNAYCFVHKHHERTFLRRKPCYRRRRWWRKKIQIQWKFLRRKTWQQQKKTRKERIFLFKKTFLFSFFVRVKKYFFRSNYLRSLLSFTVVLLELSWRHLSLYKKCCFPHTFLQFFFFIIINIIIIIIWFWFFVETKTKK